MENIVIDRKLSVLTSGVNEILIRLPDPRRYPSAIALLQRESARLHHAACPGTWAENQAKQLDDALRVLGGELPT